MAEITSRQRVLAALNHEEADRVPIDFGGRHTVHVFAHRALKQHLGLEGGEEKIRTYMTYAAEPDPRLIERFCSDALAFGVGAHGDYEFRLDPQTDSYLDEFGMGYHRPPDGLYYDPYIYPLAHATTVAEVEAYPFPDPKDPRRLAAILEPIKAAHAAGEKALMLNSPNVGIWMLPFYMRGLEQAMMDLALQPELIEALAEKSTQWYCDLWDAMLPVVGPYVDVVQMEGDLGGQDGPLFSPKLFRQLFKPRLRRVFDTIRRHTKAKLKLHACGSVYWVLPDLIDIGLEVLNPVQVNAADMDTARLKREFGRDLTFWGGGCDTIVLQYGTVEEVRAEVRHRLRDLGPGGGFVFCSIHNIQAQVPPENIVAMYDTARECGGYPIS
ncbi:MAG: uroporphyrinogen decarboxylase family protein [Chloroflexota bacterium]